MSVKDALSKKGMSLSTKGNHETNPFPNRVPEFKYIHFALIDEKPKTTVWSCRNSKSGEELGKVKWHGPWRKYAFSPSQPSDYSAGCLEDIAGFIRILMDERKKK